MIDLLLQVQEKVEQTYGRLEKQGVEMADRKYHYLYGDRIGKEEAQNIKETLQRGKPRTREERDVRKLVGAKFTPGQTMRHGLIGAAGGIGAHAVGSAIEGGHKWLPDLSEGVFKGLVKNKSKAIMHPRSLARAAAVGGIMTGALPIAKRLWDIQTAKERPESF